MQLPHMQRLSGNIKIKRNANYKTAALAETSKSVFAAKVYNRCACYEHGDTWKMAGVSDCTFLS